MENRWMNFNGEKTSNIIRRGLLHDDPFTVAEFKFSTNLQIVWNKCRKLNNIRMTRNEENHFECSLSHCSFEFNPSVLCLDFISSSKLMRGLIQTTSSYWTTLRTSQSLPMNSAWLMYRSDCLFCVSCEEEMSISIHSNGGCIRLTCMQLRNMRFRVFSLFVRFAELI